MKSKYNILLITLTMLFFVRANATGIPVVDGVHNATSLLNLAQTTKTAIEEHLQTAKQIEEYILQGKEYAQQMKDATGISEAMFIWDQAQSTINQIRGMSRTVNDYITKYGDMDTYLSQFKDLNYWRDSPCYKDGGCSEQELQEMHDSIAFGSESQNKSNSDFIRVLQQQQDALNDDAETLEKLQEQATDADGHMKALQAANQLASAQAAQMLQLRSGFNAFANAVIQRQQALQQIEAMQKSAGEALRRDTTSVVNDNLSWGF